MKIRHNFSHALRTWGLTALMGFVMAGTVALGAINVLEFAGDPLSAWEGVELDSILTLDGDFTVEYWFKTARASQWRLINHALADNTAVHHAIGHVGVSEIALMWPVRRFPLTHVGYTL